MIRTGDDGRIMSSAACIRHVVIQLQVVCVIPHRFTALMAMQESDEGESSADDTASGGSDDMAHSSEAEEPTSSGGEDGDDEDNEDGDEGEGGAGGAGLAAREAVRAAGRPIASLRKTNLLQRGLLHQMPHAHAYCCNGRYSSISSAGLHELLRYAPYPSACTAPTCPQMRQTKQRMCHGFAPHMCMHVSFRRRQQVRTSRSARTLGDRGRCNRWCSWRCQQWCHSPHNRSRQSAGRIQPAGHCKGCCGIVRLRRAAYRHCGRVGPDPVSSKRRPPCDRAVCGNGGGVHCRLCW